MTEAPESSPLSPDSLSPGQNLSRISQENYVTAQQEAKAGKPVVWVAIGVPVELLKGFNIVVAVPENHSALCAIRHAGATQAEKAEAAGYSMDLCSYARVDLGTSLDHGRGSPIHGLPPPDLLVSCTNNCSLLVKWFDVYHRDHGTPHFVLDVPFCYETQARRDRQFILDQFADLVAHLEDLTGASLDRARVETAFEHTRTAVAEWKRFLGHAAHRPAGITAFDSFVHMGPYITALRGTATLAEHFRLLADTTARKVAAGQFPVPNERYRLLWDNIAPWHQMRHLSGWLASKDANLIYATYTSCIGSVEGTMTLFPYDDPDVMVNLARGMNLSVCPSGLHLRFQVLREMIRRLAPDGIVFASNRSCKPYSVMQLDLQAMIREVLGLPAVMVEVDHADERAYNESQAHLRIEALLEEIDQRRAG